MTVVSRQRFTQSLTAAYHQSTGVSLGLGLKVGQVSGQPVRVPFGGLRGKPQPRALSPSCGSLGTGPWVIPTLRPLSIQCSVSQHSAAFHCSVSL